MGFFIKYLMKHCLIIEGIKSPVDSSEKSGGKPHKTLQIGSHSF